MALTPLLQKQLDRWYPLEPIPVQLELVAESARFVVVAAGRRSGKTERAKRKIIKECMTNPDSLYFIAAPTYSQVKKIYWQDVKMMALTAMHSRKPSESELIIYFPNGTELHLIGLDKPTRIEGVPWDGGIIDEAAYIKPEAWTTSIAPALNTKNPTKPDYKAWCWLIGKPAGLNYFYDLYQYATVNNDPNWAAYKWFSSEVLDAETLEAAKKTMSVKQYREEYEASFESTEGRIYPDYGPDNYVSTEIEHHEQIHYYCDFNYTPMSHGVAVIRNDAIYCLDEIVLTSAKGYMNVMEFCEKYKHHANKKIKVYGDRSGRNGEIHNFESEYIMMEHEFFRHGWTVDLCVPKANPGIKERQNCLNRLIRAADGTIRCFVNPITSPYCHRGLSTVVFKEGSTFQEEQTKNDSQHITTGLGYMASVLYPIEYEHDFESYRITNIFGV